MTDHPPYTGPDVTCTKCGYDTAATEYRAAGRCLHDSGEILGMLPNPRLHRTCDRCGHAWDEATVDRCTNQPKGEDERDGVYRERARLIALVAGGIAEQAVVAPALDIEEPGWQIVYVTLHGRQCSWHISPRDADLFAHLDHVPADDPRAQWDGHTTEEKYERIDSLSLALGTPGPFRER
ncbi:hypothetical protein [Streptomyces sp. NPDC005953]|uniref:hypothetical protein n=1 Tax=Streptomyces sp. NPDC005953 TaxID=3156719 RepID=UPI0033D348E2